MLASEITNLTSLRLRGVARRTLTAVFRIKVVTSRIAAAIRRNRILVNMVHCVLLAQISPSYCCEGLTEVTTRLERTVDVEGE